MPQLPDRPSRRSFLATLSASTTVLALPALAQTLPDTVQMEASISETTRRNVASFRSRQWRPYFSSLRNGAILVDIQSRALHFWEADGTYHLYPSSVPMSEDLTRRGRTSVVQKVVGPTWRPTPNMRRRNPEWPAVVGPGPDNPLGTHALYLGWTYYRIHGTHDTRKIGRKSSSGCIGLYNEHIAEVFAMTRIGTQVLLI
ncbi:MAG: L,D-transpeptidase [Jannaschia sp.]